MPGSSSAQALPVAPAQPLRIAAAADLQPVLPVLIETYKVQHPGSDVKVSYGSSATLATQIEQGAPFDLFLSADLSFPEKLVKDGRVADSTVRPYARGTLVLWARNDGKLPPLTPALLKATEVASVAIANPQHAPYGRAAMESLTSLGLLPALQPKLRTAENIAQAAQFVESGNATVGLLSLTSAVTPRLRAEGHFVAMPASSYKPIEQGAVLLKSAGDHPGSADGSPANAFLQFMLSPPIQQMLPRYGLSPAR
ncbi:MAG: molybdate ABC transporter substrate-binding protein [Acidobacteriaceae bacterium]